MKWSPRRFLRPLTDTHCRVALDGGGTKAEGFGGDIHVG